MEAGGKWGWTFRGVVTVTVLWLLMVFIDSTWTLFYITTMFGITLPLTALGVHLLAQRMVSELHLYQEKRQTRQRKRDENADDAHGYGGKEKLSEPLLFQLSGVHGKEGGQVPYEQLLAYLLIGAVALILRQFLFQGFLMLFLAIVILSVAVLLLVTMMPFAVILVAFAVGWCFMTYAWLASEFCRNMYRPRIFERTCDTIWYLHPIAFVAIFAALWWKKYSSRGAEYLVRSVFLFPFLLATLFFCIYWSLVSSNTTWTLEEDPYTKGSLLAHVPAKYSLGSRVVYGYEDVLKIPLSEYPLFFKPNECSRSSRGTAVVENLEQALAYIRVRDRKQVERGTLVQRFHNSGGEATVIYYRFPHWSHGKLKTVWDKVQAIPAEHTGYLQEMRETVDADREAAGEAPMEWKEYAYWARDPDVVPRPLRNSYNKTVWAQPVILDAWVTESPALLEAVEEIVNEMPGQFTAVRFDIKYSSLGELADGKFFVLEADMPPFGDRREKFEKSSEMDFSRFSQNLRRMRTFFMHFTIGFMNIGMGYTPGPLETMRQVPKLVERSVMCGYNGSMSPITPGLQ